MPIINITRDSGYADSLRAYKLILDGNEIGKIGSGESKAFTVSAGEHTIQAKIDWCSSPLESFNTEDAPVSFEIFSKLRGFKLLGAIIAVFNPRGWIGLRRSDAPYDEATQPKQIGEQGVPLNRYRPVVEKFNENFNH